LQGPQSLSSRIIIQSKILLRLCKPKHQC
jgi:hypothetical protein